jgi:hypothetical protein
LSSAALRHWRCDVSSPSVHFVAFGVGQAAFIRSVLAEQMRSARNKHVIEAMRDAGHGNGSLRVSAEIVHEADREKLHLLCEDDGVGIAEANLARLADSPS